MPLVVEAIDHHPVVARQRLEYARGFIAKRPQRGGGDDSLEALLQIARQIDGRPGPLQSMMRPPPFGRWIRQSNAWPEFPTWHRIPRGTSCSESARCDRSFL